MSPLYHSQTVTRSTVADVATRLLDLIPDHRFRVLHVHDVAATLRDRGLERAPYRIIEFCRAPAAHRVLQVDPNIGLFLPCRCAVYQQGDDVVVAVFRPTAITKFFPDADLGDLPQTVETDILDLLQKL